MKNTIAVTSTNKMGIIRYYLSPNSIVLKLCKQKYICNNAVAKNKII